MATRGLHPYSGYATSEGNMIYAMSSLDIIIDIAGIYFPLRSLSYKKNMNISDEHGTGSLDPYALVNQEQTYSGSFTYASFLVSGEKALTDSESLILHSLLEDATDEGRAKYFDIILMEAAGNSKSKTGDRARPKHDQGDVDKMKKGERQNRVHRGVDQLQAHDLRQRISRERDYRDQLRFQVL